MYYPDGISTKSRHEPWESMCSWRIDGSGSEAAGKLVYDGHGLLLLHSMKAFDHERTAAYPVEYIERAVCVLETGESAVCEGLRIRHYQSSRSVNRSTYRVARAFVGDQISCTEKFDGISAEIAGLPEWMNQDPIIQKTNRGKITSEGELPTGPKLKLSDGTTLGIGYSFSIPHTFTPNEVAVRKSVEAFLNYKDPVSLDVLHDRIVRFSYLLVLATGVRTPPTSIIVRAGKYWAGFFGKYRIEDKEKDLDPDFFRFSYTDIQDCFTDAVNSWFDFYEEHQRCLDLYFATRMRSHAMSLEVEFLQTVKSLEALHKSSSAQTLRQSFDKVLEISHDVLGPDMDKKTFVSDVLKARNYHAHGCSESDDDAPSASELFEMIKHLNLLMFAHLIDALSISEDLKKSIVSKEIHRESQQHLYSQ